MNLEKFPKEFPIGLGREAEPKETLPAVEVKNEVIWVDKNVEAPLNLKRGEPTKLGLFLIPKPGKEKTFQLKVESIHGRGALLGKTIFRDKQGNLYRDINIKGAGHIEGYRKRLYVAPVGAKEGTWERSETGSYGIVNESFALRDIEMAKKFRSFGIRTYRPFALIKLYEIINPDGQKISIEEAKKQNILLEDEEPVLELRAFATQNRIYNLNKDRESKETNDLIKDARQLVSQELRINAKGFTLEKYLEWFASNLGKNIALMHKNKYSYNGYLITHNVTLDCRLVDLDSVGSFFHKSEDEQKKLKEEDYRKAEFIINELIDQAGFSGKIQEEVFQKYQNIFDENYKKTLTAKK